MVSKYEQKNSGNKKQGQVTDVNSNSKEI